MWWHSCLINPFERNSRSRLKKIIFGAVNNLLLIWRLWFPQLCDFGPLSTCFAALSPAEWAPSSVSAAVYTDFRTEGGAAKRRWETRRVGASAVARSSHLCLSPCLSLALWQILFRYFYEVTLEGGIPSAKRIDSWIFIGPNVNHGLCSLKKGKRNLVHVAMKWPYLPMPAISCIMQDFD